MKVPLGSVRIEKPHFKMNKVSDEGDSPLQVWKTNPQINHSGKFLNSNKMVLTFAIISHSLTSSWIDYCSAHEGYFDEINS